MRIEQKAKAYDGNYNTYIKLINRIEVVKDAIKKQNYGIAMDILCKPYPEFQIITSTESKEGEDERIRKMLIKFFGNGAFCDNYTNGISDKDIVAWLEKQDKIVAYYEDRLDECACKYFNKGYKHALEKQGEQTPAWSEEDEKIYSRICYLIHSAAFENYDVDEVGKELGEYAKITDWLKAIKTRCAWKPSNEQINSLRGVINSLPHQQVLFTLYNDLKKLKGE